MGTTAGAVFVTMKSNGLCWICPNVLRIMSSSPVYSANSPKLFTSILNYGVYHNMNCVTCQKTLSGRQTKYCCRKCKDECLTNNKRVYAAQKKRRHSRKRTFVEYKGGKCEICGYCKNISSLHFHHLDPDQKDFDLGHKMGRTTLASLQTEVDKCLLLCANCHFELHHPQFAKEKHAL